MRIEICGPLGIGKSTMAKLLAQRCGWEVMHEPVKDHPYLEDFYRDPMAFAFKKDLYFAETLLKQIEETQVRRNWGKGYVFDYNLPLIQSYADLIKKTPEEQAQLDDVYAKIEAKSHPCLVIHLTAPTPFIVDRIKSRGRGFEEGVSEGFVNMLQERIFERVGNYVAKTPSSQIDVATHLPDIANDKKQLDVLYGSIQPYLPSKRVMQQLLKLSHSPRP